MVPERVYVIVDAHAGKGSAADALHLIVRDVCKDESAAGLSRRANAALPSTTCVLAMCVHCGGHISIPEGLYGQAGTARIDEWEKIRHLVPAHDLWGVLLTAAEYALTAEAPPMRLYDPDHGEEG